MFTVASILEKCTANNFTVRVSVDDEVDYEGRDMAEAAKCLEACDEILLTVFNDLSVIASFFIINDIAIEDEEERIVDYTVHLAYRDALGIPRVEGEDE